MLTGDHMVDYKERRNYPRVAVSGANVAYKVRAGFDLFNRFSELNPLRDLAKGGICFELDSRLERGTNVDMKVIVPGEKQIHVKGTIIWSNNITGNGRTFVGVQFLPFGKGKMYNSFECWERLEEIIKQYSQNDQLQ
jgi:hypothetical protein